MKWSKQQVDNSKREIKTKLAQISNLQHLNKRDMNDIIKIMQREIDKLLEEENTKWNQRAKQRWQKEGDINTKYFHNVHPKEERST